MEVDKYGVEVLEISYCRESIGKLPKLIPAGVKLSINDSETGYKCDSIDSSSNSFSRHHYFEKVHCHSPKLQSKYSAQTGIRTNSLSE